LNVGVVEEEVNQEIADREVKEDITPEPVIVQISVQPIISSSVPVDQWIIMVEILGFHPPPLN
jgi:hypothetical protein